MNEKDFEKIHDDILGIYVTIFRETLKDRALKIGLSDIQWKELCNDYYLWDKFTNFFDKLFDELEKRKINGYSNIDDLLSPYTEDLESQITEQAIKYVFIRHLFRNNYDQYEAINCLYKLDLYDFVEKFKNNQIGDFLKKINPIEKLIKIEIPFEYSNSELLNVYNDFFNQPLYPDKGFETDSAITKHIMGCITKFNSIYGKQDKNATFEYLKYISNFFYDNTTKFLSSYGGGEWSGKLENFDLTLLKILLDNEKEIVEDKFLSHFYCGYLIEKIKLLYGFHAELNDSKKTFGGMCVYTGNLKIGESCGEGIYKSYFDFMTGEDIYYQIYISKDKLEEFISKFENNEEVYDLLKIYYMLYGDILKREDMEQFIKELLYRLKKLSDKDDNVILGLKEYLMFLFCNVFVGSNGGEKPEYFDSIAEDIKDIFGEKDYKRIELLFSDQQFYKSDIDNTKDYKIGLIFGDIKSKKAFDTYSNDKKNEKDFSDRCLNIKQFNILAEEYYDQQDLDIERKLQMGDLTFALVFETDHETKLRNLMKIYPDRIIVCNIPGQHFSHTQFCKMLDLGLMNAERFA